MISTRKILRNVAVLSLVAVMTASLMGCVLAIPAAISYFKGPNTIVAAAEVDVPADEVYKTVLREAERTGPDIKIVKRNDPERLIDITDGVQTATVKVSEEGRKETEIIVVATAVEREKDKELSLRVINHLCAATGETCEIRGK
ncbi:MAG: hypothetical protein ACM3ON_01590 [Chloroflexota bacterium]